MVCGNSDMKCATRDCENESWRNKFDGNLCTPCHDYYTKILGAMPEYSQAFKNDLAHAKYMIKHSEIYKIEQKYK